MSSLTSKAKVLIAAVHLEERGEIPFSRQQIVMEAWKRFPQTFGMKGLEEQHPDSHAVIWILCGDEGLPKRGLLCKASMDQYVLTPKGRNLAYEVALANNEPLGKPAPTPLPAPNGMPHPINDFLNRIIDCRAFQKATTMTDERITFEEAMELWGLHPTAKGEIISVTLEQFDEDMNTLDSLMRCTRGEIIMHRTGRSVGWEDIHTLNALNKSLRRQCHTHLLLLKERK